jgi:hypothetical protein
MNYNAHYNEDGEVERKDDEKRGVVVSSGRVATTLGRRELPELSIVAQWQSQVNFEKDGNQQSKVILA